MRLLLSASLDRQPLFPCSLYKLYVTYCDRQNIVYSLGLPWLVTYVLFCSGDVIGRTRTAMRLKESKKNSSLLQLQFKSQMLYKKSLLSHLAKQLREKPVFIYLYFFFLYCYDSIVTFVDLSTPCY